MKIVAHRGYWKNSIQKNSLEALTKAIELGYGVETDLRDYDGKLVISHDIANGKSPLFSDFLKEYNSMNSNAILALNVKADGLQALVESELNQYSVKSYFLFDMSIPEQYVYIKNGFRIFTRQSEFEETAVMYNSVEGVWLDEIENMWIEKRIIEKHLKCKKKVGIISPEIHKHDVDRLWRIILEFKENENLILCTDRPDIAREYFL